MSTGKEKESDIQRTILEYLEIKKIFHYRNNSGAFVKDKHFYRFGAVGSPDIICVKDGKYIGIEVKGKTGKQSDGQIKFQEELESAGGVYILARGLDDIMKVL